MLISIDMHNNIITHEEKSDHDLQDQMSRSQCKLRQITMSPKTLEEQTVMMICKVILQIVIVQIPYSKCKGAMHHK